MFLLIVCTVVLCVLLSIFGKRLAAFIKQVRTARAAHHPLAAPAEAAYPWALPVHVHTWREMMEACNLFADRILAYPPDLLSFDPDAPIEASNQVRISIPASFPGIIGFSIHPHATVLRNDRHSHSFTVPDNTRLALLSRLFRSLDYQKSLIDYATGRLSAQAYSSVLVQKVQAFEAAAYDRIASADDIIGLKYCMDDVAEAAGILCKPYLITAKRLLQAYNRASKEDGESVLITATAVEIACELRDQLEYFLQQELAMSEEEEASRQTQQKLCALLAKARERRDELELMRFQPDAD